MATTPMSSITRVWFLTIHEAQSLDSVNVAESPKFA